MSHVTGICVLTEIGTDEDHRPTEPWSMALHELGFREVADGAGGTKHPQGECWLAGFNGLDQDNMRRKLEALEFPWGALVLIKREDDTRWSVWFETKASKQ